MNFTWTWNILDFWFCVFFLITLDDEVYSTFDCDNDTANEFCKKIHNSISFSVLYIFPKSFCFIYFRVSCHTDYVTDIVCCSSSVPIKQNIVTDQNKESEREAELELKEMDVILSVSSDKTLRRNCLERKKPHEGKVKCEIWEYLWNIIFLHLIMHEFDFSWKLINWHEENDLSFS